ERNSYFDSKVLSRQHAEIWEDSGKIYIKDVKSSNGTFINGERLSPEGVESEPFELKNDDIVEFGIDISGEDNKTTIHHKVAARIMCVFTDEDVHLAARIEVIPSSTSLPPNIPSVLPPATSSSGSCYNNI
ncbi:SMAD/FHA domain-containing protein, partial [Suillus plorans]